MLPKHSYIGLGYASIEVKNEQVNAKPMQGFKPEALDE